MSVRTGQSVTTVFTTSRFDTGAATNADSTPSGTLYVNGTANGATVTVTNLATGVYKAAVTLPTLAIGDVVSIVIAATVNSVAGKGKVWEDSKDVNLDSSGNVTPADASITDAKITMPAEASGRPSTALAILRRVWEWVANKRTRDRSTGTVLLRNAADDGTLETQTQSTTGAVDATTKGV